MHHLDRTLHALRRARPADRVAILAAALAHADDGERDSLALAALNDPAGPAPDAVTAVIRQMHRVGEAVCEQLAALDEIPPPVVDRLATSPAAQARRNVIELIRLRADTEHAERLARLVASSDDAIARPAGQALLSMILDRSDPWTRRFADSGHRDRLDRAVAAVLSDPDHHRLDPPALAAAVLAIRPGPAMRQVLRRRDHPAWFGLRRITGRLEHPVVRRLMLRWLRVDGLAGPVSRRLYQFPDMDLDTVESLSDLLADGHLLRTAVRRRAVRQADRPRRCVPPVTVSAQLPEDAQRAMPAYITALGMGRAAKASCLSDLVALPDPIARLHTVNALDGRDDDVARQATAWLARDRCDHIAAIAARRAVRDAAVRAGTEDAIGEQALADVRDGGPARWSRRAVIELAGRTPQHWIEHGEQLSGNWRLAAARRVAARDRTGLVEAIANRLIDRSAADRAALVTIVRRLALVRDLTRTLRTLLSDRDARLVATVVAALGEPAGAPETRAMRDLLEHDDGRVRANAVDALARSVDDQTGPLRRALDDPHGRVVANAAVSLHRHNARDGMDAVRSLLDDSSAARRRSGIWAGRRTGDRAYAPTLARLAEQDDIPDIRARAAAARNVIDARAGGDGRTQSLTMATTW